MKNLSLTINFILAIAVIILFYLVLSKPSVEEVAPKKAVVQDSAGMDLPMQIIYVDTDTIFEKYDLVKQLQKDLTARENQYKNQLQGKVKALQDKYAKLREDAPTLTQVEGEKRQMALMQEEETIGKLQEDLSVRLAEEENALKLKIRKALNKQLELIKAERGVDIIMDISSTSSVLASDSALDATNDILDKLNAAYKADQETTSDKKK